jgi:hypothetical protein
VWLTGFFLTGQLTLELMAAKVPEETQGQAILQLNVYRHQQCGFFTSLPSPTLSKVWLKRHIDNIDTDMSKAAALKSLENGAGMPS